MGGGVFKNGRKMVFWGMLSAETLGGKEVLKEKDEGRGIPILCEVPRGECYKEQGVLYGPPGATRQSWKGPLEVGFGSEPKPTWPIFPAAPEGVLKHRPP